MKNIIIDCRMRDCEKQILRDLGYQLIEIPKSDEVCPEISSHVDIFACLINNIIFAPKSICDTVLHEIGLLNRLVSDWNGRNSVKLIPKM